MARNEADKRRAQCALDDRAARRYLAGMKPIFDMDDRARLPWRFFGARTTALASL
jgi:hypothetical protein